MASSMKKGDMGHMGREMMTGKHTATMAGEMESRMVGGKHASLPSGSRPAKSMGKIKKARVK